MRAFLVVVLASVWGRTDAFLPASKRVILRRTFALAAEAKNSSSVSHESVADYRNAMSITRTNGESKEVSGRQNFFDQEIESTLTANVVL